MKARIILPVALVAAGVLLPSASSTADTNPFGTCPDHYQAVPFLAGPEIDKNGNGVICVKFVDMHENIKDDPNGEPYECNGFPTPPPGCESGGVVLIGDDL
jgi:hypothetical protein